MVKNPRAKGNRVQRELITMLENHGWLVGKVEVGGKFVKQKDLFGLFDLCAMGTSGEVMFIQVTCNRPHAHKKYEAFAKKYAHPMLLFRQYVRVDRNGWKTTEYTKKGRRTYQVALG